MRTLPTTAGRALAAVLMTLACTAPAQAVGVKYVDFPLRGKKLTLAVYSPTRPPIGTIVMGSGDVGWVGLGVAMAEFLSDRGYLVIGVNVRQYLSSFNAAKTHLTVTDPPADFRAMADWLRQEHLLVRPVMLSGVSEGAALAVLAAADPKNHDWIDGVVTMGIPAVAELAWKWTDIGSWITKTDAKEPSFAPYDFVGGIAPVPFVMLQSTRDEYVPARDYERCHANANDPKKLVLIDASNHRFTDRRSELQRHYLASLDWIQQTRTGLR